MTCGAWIHWFRVFEEEEPRHHHEAANSQFGRNRGSAAMFGVPPCHVRLSRSIAHPAGRGQNVKKRQSSCSCSSPGGCQSSDGMPFGGKCVPGMMRMGPFSQVNGETVKLAVTTG